MKSICFSRTILGIEIINCVDDTDRGVGRIGAQRDTSETVIIPYIARRPTKRRENKRLRAIPHTLELSTTLGKPRPRCRVVEIAIPNLGNRRVRRTRDYAVGNCHCRL